MDRRAVRKRSARTSAGAGLLAATWLVSVLVGAAARVRAAGLPTLLDDDASGAPPAPAAVRAAASGEEAGGILRLSLQECISRALEAAPELALARAEVGVGEAKLGEAKASRFFPEARAFSFTGPARRARGTVLDPQDTVDTHALGPFTKVEVRFIQPLFTAGKITAGIEAATHAVEAKMAAGEGRVGEIREQVKTLYYNALLARSVRATLDEVRDAFETSLEKARERRAKDDPSVREVDILNLRVGLSTVVGELPRLEAGEAGAMEGLGRLMGMDADARFALQDEFLHAAKGRLSTLADYRERLFSANPSWKELEAGLAAKQAEVRAIEAEYWPNVFLGGGFEYAYAPRRERQLNPFAYDDFNYLRGPGAQLGIEWALNFHVTAAKVASARAELETLEARRRQAQSGLPVELDETYRQIIKAKKQMDAFDDGRRAGRALLTVSVANFDLGIGEGRDLLEGLGTRARSDASWLEATRDYNVGLATLSRIVDEEIADLDSTAAPERREERR